MKIDFTFHSEDNKKLILIFSGWSTTPDFYCDVISEGWNTAVVSDYSDPHLDINDIIVSYDTIYIIAWSLGVAVAEHLAHIGLLPPEKITGAFAVNGTPMPVSQSYGIHPHIYDGTHDSLTFFTLRKFLRRMASPKDKYYPYPDIKPEDEYDIERLKSELRAIRDFSYIPLLPWWRAYISENDLIFPAVGQSAYWEKYQIPVTKLNTGHYIPLKAVVRKLIPDLNKIGEKFGKAIKYDQYAEAQHIISKHLITLLPDNIGPLQNILEIGTGSGYFTRLLAEKLSPAKMTLVDLYPTPQLNVAREERHVVMDAEVFMSLTENNSYDLIASANTIQWFSDPRLFIHNAAGALTSSGILLCSSFLPGNLYELDVLRPTSMLYRSQQWLADVLSQSFEEVYIASQEIVLEFASRREMMMHLHHTGVGGTYGESQNHWHKLPDRPTLTYKPVYFIARRPKR